MTSWVEWGDEEWDRVATAVGWVTIESARLEFSAEELYVELIRSDLGRIVARGQMWNTVYQSCNALIAQRKVIDPQDSTRPDYEAIADDLRAADTLMAKRRTVVHGFWFPPYGAGTNPLAHLTSRFDRGALHEWSLEALGELCTDIRTVRDAVHGHVLAVHGFNGFGDSP